MLNNCKTHSVCKRHISAILDGEYTLTAFLNSIHHALGIQSDTQIFHIGLVGSHAYGDETPDSDYDLMVLTLMPLTAYLSPVANRLSNKKKSETWWFGKVKIQATVMDFYHFTQQVASKGYAHAETVFGEPLYTLNNSWQDKFIKEIHNEISLIGLGHWISHYYQMAKTYQHSNDPTRKIGRCLKFVQWLKDDKLPCREMLLSTEPLTKEYQGLLCAFLKFRPVIAAATKGTDCVRTGVPLPLNSVFLDILQWHSGRRLTPTPTLTTYALAAELAAPYEKNIGAMSYLKPPAADFDGMIGE